MRWSSRALYFVLGFGLTVLLAPLMAQAAGDPIPGQYTVVARSVRPISGPTVSIGMEARLAGNTLYASERAVMTAATAGTLVRGVLTRANAAVGLYYGVKAVMDAAGWAINELGTQVVQPGTPQEQLAPGSTAWCAQYGGEARCVTSTAGAKRVCDALAASVFAGSFQPVTCYSVAPWNGVGTIAVNVQNGNAQHIAQMGFYATTLPTWTPNWSTGTDDLPITDEDIFNALRQARPDLFAQLLKDENGNVIITPEVADAMNRFRQAVEAATGVAGVPVVSDPATVGNGEGDASPKSLPEYCEWATVMCDLADWIKKDPGDLDTPEVPRSEADIHLVEWSSGLGGGSCPEPVTRTVTLGGHSQEVEFSYQPLCDFAIFLNPVMVSLGLLIGMYIVAGVRNGNA